MTDTGRAAVYAAENQFRALLDRPGTLIEIAGTTMVVPEDRKFGQVEDIQRYVDAVLDFIGHSIPATVRVRKGDKKATYHYANRTIAIPDERWARREVVVLHEIAHHVGAHAHHGPEFRSTYADLIEKVMGPEARFLLQHEYFSRGLTG